MHTHDPLPNVFEAGSLSLLSGASGVGKTAFIALMATLFHGGGEIAGRPVRRTSVGYLTGDRSWRDSQQWFHRMEFPEVAQYSLVDDRSFDLLKLSERVQDSAPALIECIDRLEMPEPGIIFIDPIALFLGGNLLNYHRVALNCIAIQRYAMDTGHCLVGVCHTSKQKADKGERYLRMQDRINGTGALLGFTSTQMNLAGPDETGDKSGYLQCYVNPHHAAAMTWYLNRAKLTGLLSFVPLEPTVNDEEPSVLTQELLDIHALMPKQPGQIATAELLALATPLGVTPKTIFKRLQRLKEMGFVRQLARGIWMRVEYDPTRPGGLFADPPAEAKVH
jgi:hypothetical protein